MQDYHWWWRSFVISGGSAVYVFIYSIFYFITKVITFHAFILHPLCHAWIRIVSSCSVICLFLIMYHLVYQYLYLIQRAFDTGKPYTPSGFPGGAHEWLQTTSARRLGSHDACTASRYQTQVLLYIYHSITVLPPLSDTISIRQVTNFVEKARNSM